MSIQRVPLAKVVAGLNNREDFPESHIRTLAEDIRANGMLQKPVYRLLASGDYQIIAGECRTRAARFLGWTEIEAEVKTDVDDLSALRAMWAENHKRRDTNPIEDAKFFQRYASEAKLLDEQGKPVVSKIAEALGHTADLVRRRLSLLNLSAQFQDMLIKQVITIAAAESLAKVDSNRQQLAYAAWSKLKDEDRTTEKLTLLADHYRKAQDEELAAQAQGNMFAGMPMFDAKADYSWSALAAGLKVQDKAAKVDKSARETELESALDQARRELETLKATLKVKLPEFKKEYDRLKLENVRMKRVLKGVRHATATI